MVGRVWQQMILCNAAVAQRRTQPKRQRPRHNTCRDQARGIAQYIGQRHDIIGKRGPKAHVKRDPNRLACGTCAGEAPPIDPRRAACEIDIWSQGRHQPAAEKHRHGGVFMQFCLGARHQRRAARR